MPHPSIQDHSIEALIDSWTPKQQIAQRLIIGTGRQGDEALSPTANAFLELGVGGMILFRHDVEPFATAADCARWIRRLREECPGLLFSIDQEGGFIERFPQRWFPSIPSPRAIGEAVQASVHSKRGFSTEIAAEAADWLGFYLERLGIGMIMAPTVDVNTEASNPVIGVRAYSDDSETVVACAQAALERLKARNLIAVAKHAPGHGSSTLDSHATLPTIFPSSDELAAFKSVLPHCPALMVAHAHYPVLQIGEVTGLPATLSPAIGQLIRQQWGFEGVLITDDLCMGAITEAYSSISAAQQAIQTGMDILLYRDAGENQWAVLEALTNDLIGGQIDPTQHRDSLRRIILAKRHTSSALPCPETVTKLFNPASLAAISDSLADRTITIKKSWPESETGELAPHVGPWWIIEPDRATIPQYANDVETPTLAQTLHDTGIPVAHSTLYRVDTPWLPPEDPLPEGLGLLWVSHAPHDKEFRDGFTAWLQGAKDSAPVIQVDAGVPLALAPHPHVYVGTYRTPNVTALAQRLALWMAPPQNTSWVGETFDWEEEFLQMGTPIDEEPPSSEQRKL